MPHLAITRLMFLLGYALDESGWKNQVAAFEEHDDLFSAMPLAGSMATIGSTVYRHGYRTWPDSVRPQRGSLL
jgi:hypothetical protein